MERDIKKKKEMTKLSIGSPSFSSSSDPYAANRHRGGSSEAPMPTWLRGLLGEAFFVTCASHGTRRKNEKNTFCLKCCQSICQHCATIAHRRHPLLQIRRYIYHDVVQLEDMERLIDCAHIQAYTTNKAKVVFLKKRSQSKALKGGGNFCLTCERNLQEPFYFCSLYCKVDHVMHQRKDISIIVRQSDWSSFTLLNFNVIEDDKKTTPTSTLDDPICYNDNKGDSLADAGDKEEEDATKSTQKSKKDDDNARDELLLHYNKRKGAPHRSPFA